MVEKHHQVQAVEGASVVEMAEECGESDLEAQMKENQGGVKDVESDSKVQMEDKVDEVEDIESDSSGSFIDDGDDESPVPEQDDEFCNEEPLTEKEIDELIDDFVEVESKAAEAQEALEEESLLKLEKEVREELALTLSGDDLESAVADEMTTYREEWEATLDELETESAHLLEQLDGAGVELPSLYKWIESQAPNGCSTEAWKQRVHWVGSQMTNDVNELVADAEKYLQNQRPVRRRHGKLLEEGASGFLQKKLTNEGRDDSTENKDVDWPSFNKILSGNESHDGAAFGSKHWASVYLASTPQQAAAMGLAFPGVNEVEEIDDIDDTPSDPFVADAIANERDPILSEEQKRNFRKVKEEDDANLDRKLQLHLKQRRHRKIHKKDVMRKEVPPVVQDEHNFPSPVSAGTFHENGESLQSNDSEAACKNLKTDIADCHETSFDIDKGKSLNNDNASVFPESAPSNVIEARGFKRSSNSMDPNVDNKRSKTVIIDSDDEGQPVNDKKEIASCSVGAESILSHGLDEKFNCTACTKVVVQVHTHPLLKVIICWDCKCLLERKMNVKDSDCSEGFCGWCGQNSDLLSCKLCKTLFCNNCIQRNLGDSCLSAARTSGWLCCCCSPNLLQQLTSELEHAISSEGVTTSSSSSDSDSSGADIHADISSKRKQKKKIRRILDDAELGEETKRKIAIEKERQEHLRSLQRQFSSKSKINSLSCNYNLPDGVSAEVLGDASTGYIVNVVREKGEDPVRIPSSISAKLKAHQVAGIRFMWENIIQSITRVKSGDKGLGCILAHTMGLGKTFQVIAFLYTAMRSIDLGLRTALIVTPVNVLHNWRQEFLKWRPPELKPLRVFMLDDAPRDRRVELLAKWRAKGGVFLIGYSAFRNLSFGKNMKDRHMGGEIRVALQDGPDILVCDEAHIIKNQRADTTQALKQVKCQRRIALTGSPLQNNLMEYYCMVDFVREGFLGSSHEFRNRFQNPIENGQHTNSTSNDVKIMNQRSHILYEQLKGFVQRMDMNVVKKDLPPKTVFVIAVKLSPIQRKLYKRFLEVHGFTKDKVSNEKIRKSFFAGYQALAQIWNHPWILQLRKDRDYVSLEDEDCSSDENLDCNAVTGEKLRSTSNLGQGKYDNGLFQKDWCNDLLRENSYKELHYSGKMVVLFDILTMSSEVGDKVLVFSQSILTLDLIELYLSRLPRHGKRDKLWKKGKDWYRLDGRTASSDRQKMVERFNDPRNKRVKCALISTRAGSLGINLHAANRVVIVDGSWNPTYDLQAIYRAWRYGQTKPVFAYRLLAHATMEEKIYKRQVTKEGLAARVVDRQQVHRTISKEEMLHLFEFGDDENPDSLTWELGSSSKQKESLSRESCCSDKFMENLLGRHCPRWISAYHEHETLLQENEEEKLSKEEQDMAWEVYQKSLEWEEVPQVPPPPPPHDEFASTSERKPDVPRAPAPAPAASSLAHSKTVLRNCSVPRKCTNLSHMLTLRSQGTKSGCSTICGECAQEISWENLNRDGKK